MFEHYNILDIYPYKSEGFGYGFNCNTKVFCLFVCCCFFQENVILKTFFLQNEALCIEKLDQEVALGRMAGPSPIIYSNLRCPLTMLDCQMAY